MVRHTEFRYRPHLFCFGLMHAMSTHVVDPLLGRPRGPSGFKPTIKRFADLDGPDFFPTPPWATFALIDNEASKATSGMRLWKWRHLGPQMVCRPKILTHQHAAPRIDRGIRVAAARAGFAWA